MFKYIVLFFFLDWTHSQSICNNTCNPDDDHNLHFGCETPGGYFGGFASEEDELETFARFETTTEEIPQERYISFINMDLLRIFLTFTDLY